MLRDSLNDPMNRIDPWGIRGLTEYEKSALRPHIPEIDLNNAGIHEGKVPWYLPKNMAGITRGKDIYFRPGVYDPSTSSGIALLGHELVHVGQYRNGMTWFSYLRSCWSGYSKDSLYEKPAYAIQDQICNVLTKIGFEVCEYPE